MHLQFVVHSNVCVFTGPGSDMPINQPGTSTASHCQLDAPAASVVANATETVVSSSDSAVAEADGNEPTVLTTQSQQPVRVFSSRRMSLIFLSCQVCDPRANPGPILQDREMTANETRWLGRIHATADHASRFGLASPFAYCEWIWISKHANAVLPDAMPNQCQANANQMPTRCQPDANQMPTRCQPDANQMPRKMPIRCRIGDMSYIHACPMEYSGIPSPL